LDNTVINSFTVFKIVICYIRNNEL